MAKSLRSERHGRLILLIAEARRQQGLTQAQLADAIGRPQSFIAKLESGERRLEVIEFIDLAQALGIEPAALLMKVVK